MVAGACAGTAGPSVAAPSAASPSASDAAGPEPTRWPGTTVLATIALGGADGEIQKASADLGRAADATDLEAMWGAADGLAILLQNLTPNIERLEAYPPTAALAAKYRAAFPVMLEGAIQLRDGIRAADAAAIQAGSARLSEGLMLYTALRADLADLASQAALQQRLLVQ
jgi:hypothetical protein